MLGPASQFAYDPAVMIAYLDSLTEERVQVQRVVRRGKPRDQRCMTKTLNGQRLNGPIDGRKIARWRGGMDVTRRGATTLLEKYGLSCEGFERWAKRRKMNPILRSTVTVKATVTQGN